jgi:predicted DNA-binding transcriptional regulator YafY
MRASRLLSLLLLLQGRGRMTAQEIADELEVSLRTVYRDVESLHAAGVPLYGESGKHGGYQLVDGYRTRLTGLTAAESEALFLLGLPGPAADLGLGSAVMAAQLKLSAALPLRTGHLQERFHFDAPSWYREPERPTHLTAVADAVWNCRRLRVLYRRWTAPQEVTRVLEPYGLVLKGGSWYFVAASSSAVRTYRVAQIRRLEPLDETFERPDFDLPAYWADYLAEFETRRMRGAATVRFAPDSRQAVRNMLGEGAQRAMYAAVPDPDGWTRVTLPIESVEHAHGEFLRLGTLIEVLEPLELRDRIAATVRTLTDIYESPVLVTGQGSPSGNT